MHQISISEIQRNLHHLNDFDIIEVIDKKRNKIKGYFIESKYASFVSELSHKIQISSDKKRSLRGALQQFANSDKTELEKAAWKNHLIAKYSQND